MLCPICKQPSATPSTDGSTSVFPFCSERCKLIDLGRWLGGRYQIPVEPDDETASDGTIDPPEIACDEE